MEFAEHGCLRQHLRGMRTEHSGDAWPRTILLNFATQIAGGMAYLESLKVRKYIMSSICPFIDLCTINIDKS